MPFRRSAIETFLNWSEKPRQNNSMWHSTGKLHVTTEDRAFQLHREKNCAQINLPRTSARSKHDRVCNQCCSPTSPTFLCQRHENYVSDFVRSGLCEQSKTIGARKTTYPDSLHREYDLVGRATFPVCSSASTTSLLSLRVPSVLICETSSQYRRIANKNKTKQEPSLPLKVQIYHRVAPLPLRTKQSRKANTTKERSSVAVGWRCARSIQFIINLCSLPVSFSLIWCTKQWQLLNQDIVVCQASTKLKQYNAMKRLNTRSIFAITDRVAIGVHVGLWFDGGESARGARNRCTRRLCVRCWRRLRNDFGRRRLEIVVVVFVVVVVVVIMLVVLIIIVRVATLIIVLLPAMLVVLLATTTTAAAATVELRSFGRWPRTLKVFLNYISKQITNE